MKSKTQLSTVTLEKHSHIVGVNFSKRNIYVEGERKDTKTGRRGESRAKGTVRVERDGGERNTKRNRDSGTAEA